MGIHISLIRFGGLDLRTQTLDGVRKVDYLVLTTARPGEIRLDTQVIATKVRKLKPLETWLTNKRKSFMSQGTLASKGSSTKLLGVSQGERAPETGLDYFLRSSLRKGELSQTTQKLLDIIGGLNSEHLSPNLIDTFKLILTHGRTPALSVSNNPKVSTSLFFTLHTNPSAIAQPELDAEVRRTTTH